MRGTKTAIELEDYLDDKSASLKVEMPHIPIGIKSMLAGELLRHLEVQTLTLENGLVKYIKHTPSRKSKALGETE